MFSSEIDTQMFLNTLIQLVGVSGLIYDYLGLKKLGQVYEVTSENFHF